MKQKKDEMNYIFSRQSRNRIQLNLSTFLPTLIYLFTFFLRSNSIQETSWT